MDFEGFGRFRLDFLSQFLVLLVCLFPVLLHVFVCIEMVRTLGSKATKPLLPI